MNIKLFCNHSHKAISIAVDQGWFPGARYTNLRDVRRFSLCESGFIDIDWKNYSFPKHLDTVSEIRPYLTIAKDISNIREIDEVLKQADELRKFSKYVAIVPKDIALDGRVNELIPSYFMLGYSVPTSYGETPLDVQNFQRPTHLLGGRPEVQRRLANLMPVHSVDCNRFTFDAKFGDYFDGEIFRPHPTGGYDHCLRDSVKNISLLWRDYDPSTVIQ